MYLRLITPFPQSIHRKGKVVSETHSNCCLQLHVVNSFRDIIIFVRVDTYQQYEYELMNFIKEHVSLNGLKMISIYMYISLSISVSFLRAGNVDGKFTFNIIFKTYMNSIY